MLAYTVVCSSFPPTFLHSLQLYKIEAEVKKIALFTIHLFDYEENNAKLK